VNPTSGWRRLKRHSLSGDDEIAEELRLHIEGRIERHVEEGMPLDEAEALARSEFGDLERIRHQCVEATRPGRSSRLGLGRPWRDTRQAVRSLWRAPGFSLTAIALIAVGLGLTAVVLTLFHGYLLRPLPYPDADRLMRVSRSAPGTLGVPGTAPVPDGLNRIEWPRHDRFIEAMVAWEFDDFALVGATIPERVNGIWITPGYFTALGVDALIGRTFVDADVAEGGTVAVIGHALWQRRFGGDPNVIGQTITAHATDRPEEATQFTVVGVLPPSVWDLTGNPDLLVPLRGTRRPSLVLMQPGVTPDGLATHLTQHAQEQLTVDPDWRMHVESAQESYVASVRPALRLLLLTALLALAIVVGNVAVMVLVRAMRRERELAVRLALGARRGRVMAGWVTETAVLVMAGLAIGVGLAGMGLYAFRFAVERQFQTAVPGGSESLSLNPAVLAVLAGIALVLIGILSVVPMVAGIARGSDLVLASGSRSSETPSRSLIRHVVVMVEVGVSLVLAVGAGLMVRSAVDLERTTLGFDPGPVLRAYVSLRPEAYPDEAQQRRFYDRLQAAVNEVPGVDGVALVDAYPFEVQRGSFLEAAGRPPEETAEVRAVRQVVTAGYFATMGIGVRQGRVFNERESEAAVVVSARLAHQLWPDGNPIGQRVRLGNWQAPPRSTEPWHVVVGVVDDVAKTLTAENWPDVYQSFHDQTRPDMYLMIRSKRDHATLEREVRAAAFVLDPMLPLADVESMDAVVDRELAQPRFLAAALSGYALLALALALSGLFAVVSYIVSQRRREIAIRLALGADGHRVVRWLVAKGFALVIGGLLVGVIGSVSLSRMLSAYLYGVSPFDPIILAALVPLLLVLALVAIWIPARSASRVEPMEVLRSE
jgi:putative ABC transport system permease protein